MGPDNCRCAELPDVLPDRNIQGEPLVAGFVDEEVAVGPAVYYQCLDCRQWWRDGCGDDHALRKVDRPAL